MYIKSGIIGAITALSFAPFNIFPIFLATFAWLFVKIFETGGHHKEFIYANVFCFFFFFHIACLYWVGYPLTFNISKYWILIPFAIILIPTYLSIQLLAAVWVMKKYAKFFMDTYSKSLFFALSLNLVIFFYGNWLPGFPWVMPGYIWCCHEIFLQTLSIYGIYGLNFVTLLISGFLGLSALCYKTNNKSKAKNSLIISMLLLLFIVLFGYHRLASHKTEFTDKKVIIVQCNIPLKKKHDYSLALDNLKNHLNFSYHISKVDFIIWPEAAIPYLYKENFKQLHDLLKSPLNNGEHLISGAIRKDLSTGKIYNSIVTIDNSGKNIMNYDKSILVPFGEYIPFRKYIPIQFKSIATDIGDFDIGEKAKGYEINGIKIIFSICYESIFPNSLYSDISDKDLIVNVTNDGWFGFTSEPFQHLQIVRARAIETGLPLIRSTNYGISAVFDPCGREIGRVDIGESGIIETNIPKKIDSNKSF